MYFEICQGKCTSGSLPVELGMDRKMQKKYSVCGRRKKQQKNCRISHPREQIWKNGNTKKEGLYFMRKKWKKYRKLQKVLPEQQRMKRQGMEIPVHTDELGNVIWEYGRLTAHLDRVFAETAGKEEQSCGVDETAGHGIGSWDELKCNLGVSAGTEKEGSVYGASGHRVSLEEPLEIKRRNDLALSRVRYRES